MGDSNNEEIPEFAEDVDLILDLFNNPEDYQYHGDDNDDEIKSSINNDISTTATTTASTSTTTSTTITTTTIATAKTTLASSTTDDTFDKESVSLSNNTSSNNIDENNDTNDSFISPNKRKLDEINGVGVSGSDTNKPFLSPVSVYSPKVNSTPPPLFETPKSVNSNITPKSTNSNNNITPKDDYDQYNSYSPSPLKYYGVDSKSTSPTTTTTTATIKTTPTTKSPPSSLQHQKTELDEINGYFIKNNNSDSNNNNSGVIGIKKQSSFNADFNQNLDDEIFNYSLSSLDDYNSIPKDKDLDNNNKKTTTATSSSSSSSTTKTIITTATPLKNTLISKPAPTITPKSNVTTPIKKKRIDYDLISGTRVKTPNKSATQSKQPKGFLTPKKNLNSTLNDIDNTISSQSNNNNNNINNTINEEDENTATVNNNNGDKVEIKLNEDFCPICQSTFVNPHYSPCNHVCCYECWNQWLSLKLECPVCRERTRVKQCKPYIINK